MSDPAARPSAPGRGRGDGPGKVSGRTGRGRVAGVRRPTVASARDVEPCSESDDPPPVLARPTVSRPSSTTSGATPKTLLSTKAGAEKAAALDGVPKPAAPRPKSLTRRPTETEKPKAATASAAKTKPSSSSAPPSESTSIRSSSSSSGSTSVRGQAPPSSSGGLQIKALALSLFPGEKEAQVDDLVIARLPKVSGLLLI